MPSIKNYKIVIGKNATFNEKRAADVLSVAIRVVTARRIEIVTDDCEPYPYEIVVGRTNRESFDGIVFTREISREFDYIIKYVGTRLYIVGLGVDTYTNAPFRTYGIIKDGAHGTVLGAYYFCQNTLEYDLALSVHDSYPEKDDVEIDENCNFDYTRERFESDLPPITDGPTLYSIPASDCISQGCSIIKSRSGKLIVIDGGRLGQAEHIIRCLEHLSGGKKPVVSAWLFSHLHCDHYGVMTDMLVDNSLYSRIDVENIYFNFAEAEYYTDWASEKNPVYKDMLELICSADKVFGCKMHKVSAGDIIDIDELKIKVVRVANIVLPSDKSQKIMNINDTSVIYKLFACGQSVLFLGDAEKYCDKELLEEHYDDLKSDIVQVSHHGNGNVSQKCYEAIGAKLYFMQTCERDWYSEGGEGIFSRNIGMIRTHAFIKSLGVNSKKILTDSKGILTFEFPMKNL